MWLGWSGVCVVHIGRVVLGSMCVGVSVWLGWSGVRVGHVVLGSMCVVVSVWLGWSLCWSCCSSFDVCWIFGVVGLEWCPCCPCCRLQSAKQTQPQPNHTETPTHIEPRTTRPMW